MMGRKVLGVGPLVANEVVLWELGWLPIQGRIAMMKERFYSKLQWGGAKLSSVVFRERKDKGWAKDTQDFLKFYVEDAEAIGKCYFKGKVWTKTTEVWGNIIQNRMDAKDGGNLSWRRVYRWREGWGDGAPGTSARGERLWIKARTGDWDCNLLDWRLGRGIGECWRCGVSKADLMHAIGECEGLAEDRSILFHELRRIWGRTAGGIGVCKRRKCKWQKLLGLLENVTGSRRD